MKLRRKDLNVAVTCFGHVVWSPLANPQEWQDHQKLPAFISTSFGPRVIRIEGWSGKGGPSSTHYLNPPTDAQWEELDLTDPDLGLSVQEQQAVADAVAAQQRENKRGTEDA
jgi:hypothetical protein